MLVDVLPELLVSVLLLVYVLSLVLVDVLPELLVSVDCELPESVVLVVAVEFSFAIDEPSVVSLLLLVADAACDPAASVVVLVGLACAPVAINAEAVVAISSSLICSLFIALLAPLYLVRAGKTFSRTP